MRYPLVTMAGAFVLAGVCSGVVRGSDLAAQVVSTAFAAAVVMLLIRLLVPQSLGRLGGRLPGAQTPDERRGNSPELSLVKSDGCLSDEMTPAGLGECSSNSQALGDPDLRSEPHRMFHVKHYALLLLAAAIGGAWSMAGGAAGGILSLSATDLVARCALVLLLCAATAVFEEGLFRGIVIPCVITRVRSEEKTERGFGEDPEGEFRRETEGRAARSKSENKLEEEFGKRSERERVKQSKGKGWRANPVLVAAVFSALVFGILHASGSSDGSFFSQAVLAGDAFSSSAGYAPADSSYASAGYALTGSPCDLVGCAFSGSSCTSVGYALADSSCALAGCVPADSPYASASSLFSPSSALLFAALPPAVILAVQALLKALQAGLFGFCMAAVFLEAGSIKQPVMIHAAFNVLYLGPLLVATGAVPATYLTGNCGDLAMLALTIALLLPPSVKSARWLAREVVPYSSFHQ